VSPKKDNAFAKRSCRCNCKARAIFYIGANSEWVSKKHDMIHNYELLFEDEVHGLRLHKKVKWAHVGFFQKMRRNCIKVSHTNQLLRNEVWDPLYSGLAKGWLHQCCKWSHKDYKRGWCYALMSILENRCAIEQYFFPEV